ncbi:glycoside hydrolase family 73 protein [Acidocella sp.]|uniref:glycoside hydrolase family 73 protein n=1 Tax=Acidocella sp. TaxID=50710 RepID=UPI00260D71FE|nr:glucosaminidase domain-containing protein [Acidocella sp.]MDD2796036.1 glucosaminidase domain-containing protein [Acidocella sp.]
MALVTNLGQSSLNTTTPQPGLSEAVKHMTGMLWYEMLSELNKSGMSADTLGTGGDNFQSMFLWNVAQNDFGKYDTALAAAAARQVGGGGSSAPGTMPALPVTAAAPDIQAMPEAAQAASAQTRQAGDLLSQAKSFAKAVWPQIQAAAQQLGVPPVALLAQSVLETGWGAAAPGHNLFGIKAVDGETGTSRATHEMVDGVLVPQTSTFRDYTSLSASISDYVGQIQSGFQAAVGQNTVAGFAGALQHDGYATDTNYAAKIISISQSPLMAQVLQAVGGAAQGAGNAPPEQSKAGAL